MFYVLQNESTAARRRVPILLTDAATGTTAQTGVAITNIYPYVNINGGAFAGGAGTVAEAGYGQYYYEFDPAEVATLGLAGIHITAANCRDYDAICQVAAFNLYSAGSAITAGDVWEYDISGVITAGTAGSQLNVAAAGGGTTTGDIATAVWDYAGATNPATVKETLENAATSAANADSNTGSTQLRTSVWDFDIDSAGFNTSPPYAAGYLIAAGSGGGGITAYDVWNFDPTAMSSPQAGAVLYDSYLKANQAESNTQPSNLRPAVWDFDIDAAGFTTNPPYAAGYLINAGNGATTAGSQVWNYDISAISGAGLAGTQLNIAASAIGITAGDVWSYATREITGGLANTVTSITNPVEVSTPAMAGIANTVWNTDVSAFLTPSAGYDLTQAASATGITAFDVWNYTLTSSAQSADATLGNVDTNVTTIQGNTSNIPGDVWGYATRTLTSAAGATAGDIWDYAGGRTITGGIVTSVGDKTGYSLSGTQSFNLTGNITGNVSGSVGSVTNPVDITTNAMSGTAGSVWSYVTRTLTSGAGATAGDIWSYATRTTTGGTIDTNNDKTGYSLSGTQSFNLTGNITGNVSGSVGSVTNAVSVTTASMSGIANTVWATDVSGYTAPSAGEDLATAGAGGISPSDIWTYATRTITGGTADTVTNPVSITTASMSGVANTVWESTVASHSTNGTFGKNILRADDANKVGDVTLRSAGGINMVDADVHRVDNDADAATFLKNALTGVGASWTGNITGNVTGSVNSVTTDVNVSTTSMSGIANTVWSAGTKAITGGTVDNVTNPVSVTTTSMSGIAGTVWTYSPRTLTSGAGATAGDVWSYADRTITGGIANTVTTVTDGVTVTTNNDKSGYALSTAGVNAVQSGLSTLTQAQVGTEVDASLSDVGLTTTVTGRIDAAVSSRLASSSYTAPPTTAAIATTVWSANTRTLTSGAGATAGDVWSYNISGITASGSAGAQLNDASVSGSVVTIVNGPYRLTSIAEGTDGRIDILADSVQTIQLNCLDGFGQPFNVTGYTAAVNVYDVSGALAVTYTPTVDFASSGIVSFDIDTDVTGVTGRYTLVVELTAGAEVVQLGPLEVLVRPL